MDLGGWRINVRGRALDSLGTLPRAPLRAPSQIRLGRDAQVHVGRAVEGNCRTPLGEIS